MFYILKYIYGFLLITNKPPVNKILNKNIFFHDSIEYNKFNKFKNNKNYLIKSFDNLFNEDTIYQNKQIKVFEHNINKFNPKNIINNIDIYENYKIVFNNLNYNINIILSKYKFLQNNTILNITNKFSPKTKVYIHVEKLFPIIPIYHIGITFTNFRRTIRYDVGQAHKIRLLTPIIKITDSQTIFWGYSNKTIKEIINYEKSINHKYILGINDCRHYTRKLAIWSTNRSIPIWKIKSIINKIN